jgi:hypothetical protein
MEISRNGDGPHGMNHVYIDEHAVAERYIGNALLLEEREAFERHVVDCQECTDRLLLAGMFHARLGNSSNGANGSNGARTQTDSPAHKTNRDSAPPPALFVRLKPLEIVWILLISVFLLAAIPAVAWEIFERYSAR